MLKENVDFGKLFTKLVDITNNYYKKGYYGKPNEPEIVIRASHYNFFSEEPCWEAEIYSYQMNFVDCHEGDFKFTHRHHIFKAKTYNELLNKLYKAISKEESIEKATVKYDDIDNDNVYCCKICGNHHYDGTTCEANVEVNK